MKLPKYLLCFLFVGCSTEASVHVDTYEPGITRVKVKSIAVKSKSIHESFPTEGEVSDHHVIDIFSSFVGFVDCINVAGGDLIEKGDTLLIFNTREIEMEQSLAEAHLTRVRLEYESARLGFLRAESTKAVEALKYMSGLKEAELRFEMAQMAAQKAIMISEFDGIIVSWDVNPGKYVRVGEKVGRLLLKENILVKAYFLENEIDKLAPGMRGEVLLPSGRRSETVLLRIIPEIDDKGRVVTTWLLPDSTEAYPGMSARVKPFIKSRLGIVVPVAAVVGSYDQPVIFTIRDDSARYNTVKTHWYNEDSVEILTGINEGDRVILSNQLSLHDGTPVEKIFSE